MRHSCLGNAVVGCWTRDRKVARMTPGRGSIKVNYVNSAFHPSGIGKSSTSQPAWLRLGGMHLLVSGGR